MGLMEGVNMSLYEYDGSEFPVTKSAVVYTSSIHPVVLVFAGLVIGVLIGILISM